MTVPEKVLNEDELARRLLVLTALKKRVDEAVASVKDELADAMTVGDMKRPTHPNDDRVRLGSVTYAAGAVSASVSDSAALAAWCGTRFPGVGHLEWEPVDQAEWEAFRETYLGARKGTWVPAPTLVHSILEASKAAGEPCSPDGDLDVPGVKVYQGDPNIRARVDASVPEMAWRSVLAAAGREITDAPA